MRVKRLLYKKSPFYYNRVVQATNITRGKVILFIGFTILFRSHASQLLKYPEKVFDIIIPY